MKIAICSIILHSSLHLDELDTKGCPGTIYSYLLIAKGLSELGCDVSIYSKSINKSQDGIQYISIDSESDLVRKISNETFDAIIAVSYTASIFIDYTIKCEKKIMWWHNTYTTDFNKYLIGLAKKQIDLIVGISAFQIAINIGLILKTSVKKKNNLLANIHYIPNPLNVSQIKKYSKIEVCNESKIIAFVGNLGKDQGFHQVLQLVEEIRKYLPDVKLNIYGSNNLHNRGVDEMYWQQNVVPILYDCSNCIKPQYHLKGLLNRVDLYRDLANCDLMISGLSGIESFSVSMAESQALGVPVLSRKKGGQASFIINRKTGYLSNNKSKDIVKNILFYFNLSVDEQRKIRTNSIRNMEKYDYPIPAKRWNLLLSSRQSFMKKAANTIILLVSSIFIRITILRDMK